MNLSYKENYWDFHDCKIAFKSFLNRTHHLDLSLWDQMGFWDKHYRPFSYFVDDILVSNVCIYTMNMTIEGKKCLVAQVSAVGTIPEFRGKGLNLALTQKAIDWAKGNHDFFFLFADRDAYSFYEKCGFRIVDEYMTSLSVTGKSAQPGAVKLDIHRKDHLEQIYHCVSGREPVSDLLGVTNKKLFMFHCLYFLNDYIHYIPELEILILYKRENGVVTIFDIVGAKIPSFAGIYDYICCEQDETIEFLFMADKLNLKDFRRTKTQSNGTHIFGDFPLKDKHFIFPFTAQA